MANNKNIPQTVNKAEELPYLAEFNFTSNTVLENELYYNMPISPSTDLVMKALGAGSSSLAALPDAQRKVNHSQSITVRENGNKRQIIAKGNSSETIIEVGDIEKLIGSNKTAKKMFTLSLIKMNEQAYNYKTGSLYKDSITFPLQELVDIGYYSSIRAARRGFLQALDTLTNIKVKAKVKRGKNTYITAPDEGEGEGIRVMFTGGAVTNNQCSIELNYKINWQPLLQYFTVLPRWAFGLSNKAYDMLYAIMYFARQNTKQIKDKGYFTISFRTIQQRLNLPDESKILNPSRDIRQPIEDAVKEIEETLQAAGQEGIKLELNYDTNANIKTYLEDGFLKVYLSSYYAEPFIENSTKQEKAIEHNIKRKEAIEDRARTQALQKNIETELKDTKPQQ